MTIRKMMQQDLDAVTALEAECFSVPWSRQGFEDILYREDVVFLVAEEAGHLLGYVGIYCTADEGEITNVAVAPQARRKGVGYALLTQLMSELEIRELETIVLEVRVSNEAAIHLYEQMHFEIAGKRKNFYERPVEDAYVMVLQPAVYYGNARKKSL
ncbi:MAG: ribosomal protein S18-alanine N-acetyltransferase [Eubacterium sp.]|nr:ribosomal protein S18-alanine N-acetyltransferase [Eubacterium sp.]